MVELPTSMQENKEEFVNSANKNGQVLKTLNRVAEYLDDWLVCSSSDKLDATSRKDWEATVNHRNTNTLRINGFSSLQGQYFS